MFLSLGHWTRKWLQWFWPPQRGKSLQEVVRRKYREALGREVDPSGLQRWADQLTPEGVPREDLDQQLQALKELGADNFCIFPWVSLTTDPEGHVKPCCPLRGSITSPNGSPC